MVSAAVLDTQQLADQSSTNAAALANQPVYATVQRPAQSADPFAATNNVDHGSYRASSAVTSAERIDSRPMDAGRPISSAAAFHTSSDAVSSFDSDKDK